MPNKLVYSTEHGDLRKKSQSMQHEQSKKASPPGIKNDGIVRVQKETKGRGGKIATLIYGVPLSDEKLSAFAAELKQKCGTGGSVKDRVILIQGDKSETVIKELISRGYTVKKAGG